MFPLLFLLACTSAEDTAAHDIADAPQETVLSFDGEAPQNLIIIALDTTRRDYISRYSGSDTTPFIDGLLEDGLALDDHRSCSNWTYDSVICVQTGSPSYQHGYTFADTGDSLSPLPDEVPLFSQEMRRKGYQTGLASAQWMMGESLNTARGFDDIQVKSMASAEEINEKGLSILDGFELDQPWYLHLHYLDPHDPYSPPAGYRAELNALEPLNGYDLDNIQSWYQLMDDFAQFSETEKELVRDHLNARYRGELQYLDDQLALLFEALEARGALDDTLVVLWSDHGEQLYQHGEPTHGGSMYDEEIRALGGFWARNIVPLVWSGPTTHADLWPTIFLALGLGNDDVDGTPVGDVAAAEQRAIFTHKDRGELSLNSVTLGDHKLIYEWTGGIQFFDLSLDPEERHAIYDRSDARVQSLWEMLAPKVEAMERASESGAAPTDPGITP